MKNYFYIFVLYLVTINLSCSTNKSISNIDNLLYEDRINDFNPNFLVYHTSSKESHLYFKLNSEELLYVRENVSLPFASQISIHYKLYNKEDSKNIIDSATNSLYDTKTSKKNKIIIGRIPFKAALGKKYELHIEARDANKKNVLKRTIQVNKLDKHNKQFFLVYNAKKEVCFNYNFSRAEQLTIESKVNSMYRGDWLYFNTENKLAPPPFSTKKNYFFSPDPDSTTVTRSINGISSFKLFAPGNFQLQVNGTPSFTLRFFEGTFPKVNSFEAMAMPIRYISTKAEYQTLLEAEDKQLAVEEFWLKMSGSKERAKQLIRDYYARVEFANKYFTSYKEGWKTDRGMLSIVMGPPNSITTSARGETWVYGTSSNMIMSLTFTFDKQNETFITNDYQLDRYRSYKEYWYRAVETWRKGRVYTFN